MSRSKSSNRWLQAHFNDYYVKQSHLDGFRSRAAYKLLEINDKYQFIKNQQTIVDLGAAPGGWLQILNKISQNSKIIGLDLLNIEPIENTIFIQGNFTDDITLETLLTHLKQQPVDIVLSDMAPNMSGHIEIDIPKSMYLVELAQDFASKHLNKGGSFLIKVFQGEGFDALIKKLKSEYKKVIVCKPKASHSKSREIYLLCRDKQFYRLYND